MAPLPRRCRTSADGTRAPPRALLVAVDYLLGCMGAALHPSGWWAAVAFGNPCWASHLDLLW
eukprot:7260130-Lingulodinium_polyedra.AAC.1